MNTAEYLVGVPPNTAFQRGKLAVSHLLQAAQKLRHDNFAPEQRHYVSEAPNESEAQKNRH